MLLCPQYALDPPSHAACRKIKTGTFFFAPRRGKVYLMGDVRVDALRAVDLDLMASEFIMLPSASGSGKSTLLNILGGLDTPTNGSVYYLDHDLTQADDNALTQFRREHVDFVFQFYNLIPSLTALENVELATKISANPMDASEALARVGLSARLHHFPSQLSGGRTAARGDRRAIAKRPDILLCDEPTGALDFSTRKLVLDVLEQINRELNTTTVIITHNAAIAAVALCGIASFVTLRGAYEALLVAQTCYYTQYRFADVFTSLRRAPLTIVPRIGAIAGIAEAMPVWYLKRLSMCRVWTSLPPAG